MELTASKYVMRLSIDDILRFTTKWHRVHSPTHSYIERTAIAAQCTPPSGVRCSLKCLCRKTTPLSFYIFHIVNKLVRQIPFLSFLFFGRIFIRLDVIHKLESIRNAPERRENIQIQAEFKWSRLVVDDDEIWTLLDYELMNAAMRHKYVLWVLLLWPICHTAHLITRDFSVMNFDFFFFCFANVIEIWIKCSPLLPLRHASTVPAWGHFSEPPACINKVQIQRRHTHTHTHARTHKTFFFLVS